jgi:hypothetical protein
MPGKKEKRGRSRGPGARNGQANHSQTRSQSRARNGNNPDNNSVQAIAKKLAAEIQKYSDVGSEVSKIIPQKGDALKVITEKYLLSMSMLTDEYKQKTAFDEQIAHMQVADVIKALQGQKIPTLDADTTAVLDNAAEAVRQLHEKYTSHLVKIVTMAEAVCRCPNEQATGQECKISSTVSITKQLDSLTQKRIDLRIEFNQALNEIKKKSPFNVAVYDYEYYKKLVMHMTDDRNRHPDKHHVTNHVRSDQSHLPVPTLGNALANMRLSDVRSDQALNASLRYL